MMIQTTAQTPYWSALEFWNIKLENAGTMNLIFSLQKLTSKLIFAGYTGSKNQARNSLKIQFVEFDFSKLMFQKSSTDQQRASKFSLTTNALRYLSLTK